MGVVDGGSSGSWHAISKMAAARAAPAREAVMAPRGPGDALLALRLDVLEVGRDTPCMAIGMPAVDNAKKSVRGCW